MTDFEKKIAEHEEAIKALREEQARVVANSNEAKLANALHDLRCVYNHTDQCGWHYEIHNGVADWSRGAHARYLESARKAIRALNLKNYDFDQILDFLKALKEI